MKPKNLFEKLIRYRYLFFLIVIAIFYFTSNYWVENASDEEIQNYLESRDIKDPKSFLEPVKLSIQVIVGIIFLVMIFYVGKVTDLTTSYIERLGILETTILKIKKNKNINKKLDKELSEDQKYYEDRLKFHQNTPAVIIMTSLFALGFFIFVFIDIYQNETDNDMRNLVSLIFALMSAVANFAMLWAFYNYMMTNRQNDFKQLVYDIAKLQAKLN